MQDLKEITGYKEFKAAMDTEMQRSVESFVRIGYLLKRARDTDVLRDSEYSTVVEFAQAEYNIDKTQVSRFMAINDRFSVDGYSDQLQVQFQKFGLAKLQEMLILPDSVVEELDPKMTRSEIQEVKKEIQEEEKITDIEVMLEEREPVTFNSIGQQALHLYLHDKPDTHTRLYPVALRAKFIALTENILADAVDALAPTGIIADFVRIAGVGKILITVSEENRTVTFTNVRNNEKECMSVEEVLDFFKNVYQPSYSVEAEANWEQVYGEKHPSKVQKTAETLVVTDNQKDRDESETKPELKKTESEKKSVNKLSQPEVAPMQPKEPEVIAEPIEAAVAENEDFKMQDEGPTNAINASCDTDFTPEVSTNIENEGVKVEETAETLVVESNSIYWEMNAVCKQLQTDIRLRSLEAIKDSLKALESMVHSIEVAEKNNQIPGQMSIETD